MRVFHLRKFIEIPKVLYITYIYHDNFNVKLHIRHLQQKLFCIFHPPPKNKPAAGREECIAPSLRFIFSLS